ncbi:MAG: glycosyltransferase family 1 protein [Pirellulaceae bacterium]|nr:glycosyltransferase family 1 protein [Pirellulaceae bacterium]
MALDAMPLAYTLTGIGVYVQQLVIALNRVRPDVRLVFPVHSEIPSQALIRRLIGRNLPKIYRDRIDIQPIWGVSPFGPFSKWAPRAPRPGGYDLYHVTNALPLYREFACPKVVTVFDLAWLRVSPNEQIYFQHANALLSMIRKADHVLCISSATQTDVVELAGVPVEKTTVTSLAPRELCRPPETQLVRDASRRKYSDGYPYFLNVNQIHPRKNLPRIIAAFGRLRQAGCKHRFIIAGPKRSGTSDVLRAIEEAGVGDVTRLLGTVTDATVQELYWGCEALVCPSLYEGFGLPAIEAMASATPVIASTTGAFPEVIGDAGILVDPMDVDAIEAGLTEIWNNEGVASRLRAEGVARASQFSWRDTAERTLAVYERVLHQ